jgi:1-acyl-sn-glycerol-3-phosphate acyltransferase
MELVRFVSGGTRPASMLQVLGRILDRGWRLIGTGLSFAAFGIGGFILGLVAVVWLRLVISDRARRAEVARLMVSRTFRGFAMFMSAVGVLRWSVEGASYWRRDRGCLVVANHPTLIDVVFLLGLFDGADCVVKAGVITNPFWRMLVGTADYISNEDLGILLAETSNRLKAGRTVILFPEGTRTVPGAPLTFGPLAGLIAVRTGCELLPVVITCTPPALYKHLPWYRIPERRMHFRLRLHSAWSVALAAGTGADQRRAARALTRDLEAFFGRELGSATLAATGRGVEPAGAAL